MKNTLYIVKQSSGSYDDYISWPVAAFTTKQAAEAWVAAANAAFAKDVERRVGLYKEYEKEYDALVEKHKENKWESKEWRQEYEALDKKYADRLDPYDKLHEYKLVKEPIPLNPAI
ncbi:hypothetical protein [Hymenobacter latericus]|uniref:hypothetical protein n=1 Tax=Hymenobacter sp. YIM 151858-1 TaxID=2987688 RepID=UPI0022263581|nr:hypothetical protein [Hymenobacter sp. YIM 151858-1]UYZ60117.1 hypothetical protein OIS50_04775 [Hymenobacter sp. YIM 151858-1]